MADALTAGVLRQAQLSFGCKAEPAVRSNRDSAFPFSVVSRMELDCDGEVKVVYVKRMQPGEASRRRLLAEHDILQELGTHFSGHPSFGVPRVVGVLQDEYTIATEQVAGVSLRSLITRSARVGMLDGRASALAGHCAAAGEWLREFQVATRKGTGRFDLQPFLDYCDVRVDMLIAAQCPGIDDRFKSRFHSYVKRTHELAGSAEDEIVGCHHDYSLQHVFVGDSRISVIDFGYFAYGSRFYDVSRFWFDLERLKLNPLCRRSVVQRLQDGFFEGYGTARGACGPVFELIASRYFLVHLTSLQAKRRRRGFRGWMNRRAQASCLHWLHERCS